MFDRAEMTKLRFRTTKRTTFTSPPREARGGAPEASGS
jgi:hypothetical protein